MRRFEALMQKPVGVREIDVEGDSVITREGIAGGKLSATTRDFTSAAEAKAYSESLVAEWRAAGFIEIKRIAAAVSEEPIKRSTRREWDSKHGKLFEWIEQKDAAIRIITGRVKNGDDIADEPEIEKHHSIKEASTRYEALVAQLDLDIASEKTALEEREARAAEKKEAKRVAKQQRNAHPELEAQCRAAPNDPQPWSVYADWLIDRGDPVGEAAALALRGDLDRAKSKLRSSFTELHAAHDDEVIDFELRYGFVSGVLLKPGADLPALVKRVLLAPCMRFVDSLRFGLSTQAGYENDWSDTLVAVCELPIAANLRELRFDAHTSDEAEISWVPYGDLAFAWPKLPALEVLHIRAGLGGNLGTLDLPKLRSFTRESGGLRRHDVEAICALPRPHLEELELWTGTDRYEGEIALDDLRPILEARGFPALRHLGIVNSELSDVIIPALVASRILPQLHSLDLSKGIFANVATDALIEHAAAFRHLASLDLSQNLLYDGEVERIRAVLDNVIVDGQRPDDREDDFPDDPGDRYILVSE